MTKRYYKYPETHRTVKGRKQKYCTTCKEWKGENEFGRDRHRRDGLKMRCKTCDTAYGRELRRRRKKNVREYLRFEQRHRIVKGVRQKLCAHCKQWKDESDFHRNRGTKDGLALWCRECEIGRASKHSGQDRRGARRNLRYEERHRVVAGVKQKLCGDCDQWKEERGFYRNAGTRDGLGFDCKECHRRRARERCGRKNKGARTNLRYDERHRVIDGVREKLCTKCRKWKRDSEYYKCKSSKDGLMGRCQKCSYTATTKSGK